MKIRTLLLTLSLALTAPEVEAKQCFKGGSKLGPAQALENGMVAQGWDSNGDGKLDVITMSHSESKTPLFYIIDKDQDGYPEKVLIDRDGDCKLVLYQDLTVPHDTGLNFQHPQQGMGREI